MLRKSFYGLPLAVLFLVPIAQAQIGGTLEGSVKDDQGLVIPGVTVTLSGEALIAEQVAVTLEDGTYRFRSLRPGTYAMTFALPGFQTLNREGIIVEGNRTFEINVALSVATVAETVTVTGESPVVDVKNTSLSQEFGITELQEVPSATDVWAVLRQTPGVRMRGFDVGGSHKSQQSNYESYGIRSQNRVMSDGVDTTEGGGGTGFYYDYYSVEEFTTSAAGSDVEMTTAGSLIQMTVKSGGNQFSGLYHISYEAEGMVSSNLDDETAARGFTGNPNLFFLEGHVDLGGPIMTDKAWFYGFYNYFKIDKVVSGVDPNVATDIGLFDQFGGKVTWQVTDKDQFIGYSNYQLKQKPNRGLSSNVGPEAILAQDSWSWLHKAEWQRVVSDRAFVSVQLRHFGFGWPMQPQVSPDTNPPRTDSATSVRTGAGWRTNAPPFTFNRWKPQFSTTLNYYLPSAGGSHDFKFGYDFQLDSSQFGSNSNSGNIRYLDNSDLGPCVNCATGQLGATDEIQLYNMPPGGGDQIADDRDKHHAIFAQDTWSPNERLTLNLGFRFERQDAYYTDTELAPEFSEFFPTGSIPGATNLIWNNFAPRLGVTYDLGGDGKTILKGHYGRYYFNINDSLSGANPATFSRIQHKFLDQNGNGLYDGVQELGELVSTRGLVGTELGDLAGTEINKDMAKTYADEFSVSFEHEVAADTSLRFSYVRKQGRNGYGTWDKAEVLPLMKDPVPCGDALFPCPADPFTGAAITTLVRLPDSAIDAAPQNVIDTYPGGFGDADYDTITFAANRRFDEKFFLQGSFDYQWRDEPRRASGESGSPLNADPISVRWFQNHNPAVDNRQANTNWTARFLARYVFPADVAVSTNIRVQSGWPWAPIFRVSVPGSGTRPVFLEDIDQNRSETVPQVDLRLEKNFVLGNRFRLAGMVDFYNLLNTNAETNFTLRTGSTFNNIIAVLDPRAIMVAARFTF